MLTLRPTGGLGNRILAIDSAIKLCEETGHGLHIYWILNHYLNCSFFELFLPIQHPKVSITFEETPDRSLLYSDRESPHLKQKVYNFILKKYQRRHFDRVIHSMEMPALLSRGYDFKKDLGLARKPFLSSCYRFYSEKLDQNFFQPVSDLQRQIDQLTKQYSSNTVGIHIRRTDHVQAIQTSPTTLFMEEMEKLLREQPETKFFLATDDAVEKTVLKERFGSLLLMQDELDADRNSTTGMQKAVVDMWALASCQQIIGSFRSTFSSVAAELGNIPFTEIKQNS